FNIERNTREHHHDGGDKLLLWLHERLKEDQAISWLSLLHLFLVFVGGLFLCIVLSVFFLSEQEQFLCSWLLCVASL
ncbi:unnamed protein product, partial [Prunus brigantina]